MAVKIKSSTKSKGYVLFKEKSKTFDQNDLKTTKSSLMAGIVAAIILLMSYYMVSLLDLWETLPAALQPTFYFLTLLASVVFCVLGFSGKFKLAVDKAKSRLFICSFLTLIIALMSWNDFSRLTTLAFKPRALFDYPQAEITATLTAPLYLQKQTFTKDMNELDTDNAGLNPVYEGSVLDVHVRGTKWAPEIKLSDGKLVAFSQMNDGSFKASTRIDKQISWSVRQGSHILGAWPIILIDDEEPEINRFTLQEHENDKGYLAFNIEVKDDRKIMRAAVEVVNAKGEASDLRNLSIREVKSYKNIFYLDFTDSDLAGATVDLRFSVEDEAGQVSTARLSEIIIPEKRYSHAIAGKLISLHKELNEPGYDLRALARQVNALGLLSDNEGLPPVYYMALRSAYWRLVDPSAETDRETARNLLWDIAQKLEDSELGPIENDLIASLDELTLVINQKKNVTDIRDALRNSDRLFRAYTSAMRTTISSRYSLDIDIQALRKLYSYILAFSDQQKHHNAALIVDFMRKGLVENDDLILSKGGLGNYFALSESRQIIDNLIAIQKTLLASSYNEQMQGKLVQDFNVDDIDDKRVSQKHSQIILQTKVGDAVKLLGEKISFAGDNSDFLIRNASDLVEEILTSMKNSETNQVTQSQSELIAIMSNLKRVLNKPISKSPKLQNILKEINAKPVS